MTITKLAFWKAAAERTVGTVAATAVALITANDRLPGVVDVDWVGIGSISVTAGIVTVLKALASTGTGNGPSLFNNEALKE